MWWSANFLNTSVSCAAPYGQDEVAVNRAGMNMSARWATGVKETWKPCAGSSKNDGTISVWLNFTSSCIKPKYTLGPGCIWPRVVNEWMMHQLSIVSENNQTSDGGFKTQYNKCLKTLRKNFELTRFHNWWRYKKAPLTAGRVIEEIINLNKIRNYYKCIHIWPSKGWMTSSQGRKRRAKDDKDIEKVFTKHICASLPWSCQRSQI